MSNDNDKGSGGKGGVAFLGGLLGASAGSGAAITGVGTGLILAGGPVAWGLVLGATAVGAIAAVVATK